MQVINYFESDRQPHWLEEIRRSDWGAGSFLADLLGKGTFFDAVGEKSKVLLLTEGDALISYCTYAERDDIQPTDLTPWMGFVYTFPEYRGHRYVGKLFEEIERIARADGTPEVYISTNHIGLYETYGCEFKTMMNDMDGNPSRVYVKRIPQDGAVTSTEEENTMFQADMVAPCGLDCNICSQALIAENPCPGCSGPDDRKPEFCAKHCGIILCEKRRENGYRYCDECPDYPCDDVMEKENRYTTQYPHRESPLENLRMIREKGMDAFLEYERRHWTCPSCGNPFSVHHRACGKCGKRIGE